MPSQRSLFESQQTLEAFCEKIVLPNMTLRTFEEELFEDDAPEYVRRDLESASECFLDGSEVAELSRDPACRLRDSSSSRFGLHQGFDGAVRESGHRYRHSIRWSLPLGALKSLRAAFHN